MERAEMRRWEPGSCWINSSFSLLLPQCWLPQLVAALSPTTSRPAAASVSASTWLSRGWAPNAAEHCWGHSSPWVRQAGGDDLLDHRAFTTLTQTHKSRTVRLLWPMSSHLLDSQTPRVSIDSSHQCCWGWETPEPQEDFWRKERFSPKWITNQLAPRPQMKIFSYFANCFEHLSALISYTFVSNWIAGPWGLCLLGLPFFQSQLQRITGRHLWFDQCFPMGLCCFNSRARRDGRCLPGKRTAQSAATDKMCSSVNAPDTIQASVTKISLPLGLLSFYGTFFSVKHDFFQPFPQFCTKPIWFWKASLANILAWTCGSILNCCSPNLRRFFPKFFLNLF